MIIDFRARPNTKPYMTIQEPGHWTGPAGGTKGFGYDPGIGTLEEFIASLEANDIGKAVFTGRQIGTNDHLIAGITNDYIAECIARYPDKLIGFAGIDPTTGAAAPAELERAVKQLGLRGVSMDPDFVRLTPDDPTYYPIYEKAVELKIPVVLTLGPLVGRFGNPWAVDVVAEAFPQLTIVCSHGCWPQVTALISLPYRRANVYLEASIYEFLPGAQPFIEAAKTVIQDRVIYASAFPFQPLDTAKRFRQLGFSEEVLHKLMYANAARVLGLDEAEATRSQ